MPGKRFLRGGKLKGELSFPRENFSFSSCQNRVQRGFGNPSRGEERAKSFFNPENNPFLGTKYIFSSLKPLLTIRQAKMEHES